MKKIILERLTLRLFKGITNFTLETVGSDVNVYGDNAVGKTTLFDAFTWLLFDKDSQNKSGFSIKPLDASGNVLHNLEHEVEAILSIDGISKKLRKVFKEKWTKKRGATKQEFDGHTTDFYIDDVPAKQAEYKAEVAGIIAEDLFKLLTSPTFFNEQMKWEDRRRTLLQVCGNIEDSEVIASNKELAGLPVILADRKLDDHIKVIKARRTKINEELKDIPIRIDEANRSKPEVPTLGEDLLDDDIATLKARIQEKESELVRIQSGGEVAVKEKRLREIEGELQQLKNELQAGTLDKVSAQRRVVGEHQRQVEELEFEIRRFERQMKANEQIIAEQNGEKTRLARLYKETNERTFTHDHQDDCPTCGQRLPEEKISEALVKAEAVFNRTKSDQLEQISIKGKAAATEIRRLEQENAELGTQKQEFTAKLTNKRKELQITENKLTELQSGVQDATTDPAYMDKLEEIEAVKREILGLRSSAQGAVDQLRMDIAKIRNDVAALEQDKAKFAQVKAIDQRIIQLEQQEQTLAAEFEKLEQELYLTEEFIRTKVAMLEKKINSKFKHARFKLFNVLVNGAVEECCETTYEGVPYSSGLNNAARINVGLDIINTLSEHYGFTAPIFIDNAEAVTEIIKTVGQQIKLIVPPTFDRLPLEAQEQLINVNGGYQEALAAWKKQNKQLRIEHEKVKEAV